MIMPLVTNSLFIEDRSGQTNDGRRGATLKRHIVVRNLGDRPADVDLWIVATEQKAEPLLRWCSFSERNPLHLEAAQSRDVTLTFEIPPQAIPDVYCYEILVEARAAYPNMPPVRRPQEIRVLPSAQDAEWDSDPVVTLKPITQADQPYLLPAGEALDLIVSVKNCSKRVDRFHLTCPELSPQWFTVHYPENSLETPGLIRETEGLELNPGDSGEIRLTLHPPRYTPAGKYFPTLRLTSSNDDNLVLLDIVYLQVLVSDRLEIQTRPELQRIPKDGGCFDLTILNQGNIARKLRISATDPDQVFKYILHPAVVSLEPGGCESLHLKTMPKKWWYRPWWGKGREFQFEFYLEDLWAEPISDAPPLALVEAEPGTLLWQARPLWVLILLLLAALGFMGAIAFLIWLLFFKPPAPRPQPEIVAFEHLGLDVTESRNSLTANNGETVRLNWEIRHLDQVDRIVVVHLERGVEINRRNYSLAGMLPETLAKSEGSREGCETSTVNQIESLQCTGIPMGGLQPGDHTFQLQVFSLDHRQEPVDTRITDSLAIAHSISPQIIHFSPTDSVYQIPGEGQASGAIAPPIRLNWEIAQADQIQELQLVGTTADGTMISPMQRYSFANGLPGALQGLCTLDTRLICQDLPTVATQAGTYQFQLTVIAKETGSEVVKQTPLIHIQQVPIIQSFQLDGQDIAQNPRHRVELNPDQPTTITLSWQVEADPNTQVELLPVPGSVPPQGSIEYPLSGLPGQETLTLRITTAAGEQITRAIVIETVASPPPPVLPAFPLPKPPAPKPDLPNQPEPTPKSE
jgi:hypothetical protein